MLEHQKIDIKLNPSFGVFKNIKLDNAYDHYDDYEMRKILYTGGEDITDIFTIVPFVEKYFKIINSYEEPPLYPENSI